MNKIIQFIIIILAASTGMKVYGQTVGLRLPDTTAVEGDILDIPVYVDNDLTGMNVISYQLEISFNSVYLEALEASTTGTISSDWDQVQFKANVPGKITISAASAVPLSGKGKLILIRFKCFKSGSSNLNFTGEEYNLLNEGEPDVSLDNGYISIKPKPVITVTPNEGLLTSGDQLQFNVQSGIPPYQWSVTIDSVGSVNSSGLFTAMKRGFTKVVAEDATGIIDTTNNFIEVRGLTLSVPDTTGWQGNIIEIPIYASNVDELGIVSGLVTLSFNTNIILYAKEVNKNGTLLESCNNLTFNTSVPGEVSISFATTDPLTGSGPLVYISYMVSHNNGGTYLDFAEAIFNEDIYARPEKGYFIIKPLPDLTVTPSTVTLLAGETETFVAGGGVEPYTWSTSAPAIASIDGAGVLTANMGGIVFVTVSDIIGASGISDTIFVYDALISLPDTTGELRETIDMPVYITDIASGLEVSSIEADINYQMPELEGLEIVTTGTITEGWTVATNFQDSIVHLAAASATGFNTSGILFFIRFQLTEEFTVMESVNINIDHIMLNEGSPNALTKNGSITGIVYGEDLSLACVTNLSDACEPPDPIELSLTITNAGGKTYHVDDTLFLGLILPGEPLIQLFLILTEELPPAGFVSHQHTEPFSEPYTGAFASGIFVDMESDINRANDTVKISVMIFGYPEVDLGEQFVEVTTFPFILDAGPGFDSYQWQDGSTGQKLSAEDYGIYWVEVSLHGCTGSDTATLIPVSVFEINANSGNKLHIYPNPNHGTFKLESYGYEGDILIEIFNIQGKLIYTRFIKTTGILEENINLSKYGKGIYLLKTGKEITKIVVY